MPKEYFEKPHIFNTSGKTEDGSKFSFKSYIKGDLRFAVKLEDNTINGLVIENVFYSAHSAVNVLSCSHLTKTKNSSIIIKDQKCTYFQGDSKVFEAHHDQGNFVLNIYNYKLKSFNSTCNSIKNNFQSNKPNKVQLWHHRFCHINLDYLKRMIKDELVSNVDLTEKDFSTNPICKVCLESKACRLPYKSSSFKAKHPLQLIHSDVCEMPVLSVDKCKYYVTFLDDFSHFAVAYPIRSKSEVFDKFKHFLTYTEKQTGFSIKNLRTDNGTEYLSNAFKDYLTEKGIDHQLTVPYNPSSNGKSERLNRTLNNSIRALLIASKLNHKFWAEALETTIHVLNRIPCSSHPKTPFELFLGY